MHRFLLLVIGLGFVGSLAACHPFTPSFADKIEFIDNPHYFASGSRGVVRYNDNCVKDIFEDCDSRYLSDVSVEFSDPSIFEVTQVHRYSVEFNVLAVGRSELTVSGLIGSSMHTATVTLESRAVDEVELKGSHCPSLRGEYAYVAPSNVWVYSTPKGNGQTLSAIGAELVYELPEGVSVIEPYAGQTTEPSSVQPVPENVHQIVISENTSSGSVIGIQGAAGGNRLEIRVVDPPLVTGIRINRQLLEDTYSGSRGPNIGAKFDFNYVVCDPAHVSFMVHAGPLGVCHIGLGETEAQVNRTWGSQIIRFEGPGICEVMVEVESDGVTFQDSDSFEVLEAE